MQPLYCQSKFNLLTREWLKVYCYYRVSLTQSLETHLRVTDHADVIFHFKRADENSPDGRKSSTAVTVTWYTYMFITREDLIVSTAHLLICCLCLMWQNSKEKLFKTVVFEFAIWDFTLTDNTNMFFTFDEFTSKQDIEQKKQLNHSNKYQLMGSTC